MNFSDADERTEAQRQADEEVLEAVERRQFFPQRDIGKDQLQAALQWKQQRLRARRMAARLGEELGFLRRTLGLTQREVAEAMRTQGSAISRIESGEYGGITIEKLVSTFLVIVRLSPQGLWEVRKMLSKRGGAPARILLDFLDEALEEEPQLEGA